jgi:hypothetical protein
MFLHEYPPLIISIEIMYLKTEFNNSVFFCLAVYSSDKLYAIASTFSDIHNQVLF